MRTIKLNFSFGYQPHKLVSFGGTLKYIFKDMTLDGTSYGKSSGIGYDVGLLISPLKNLRFGFGFFDLGGTSVSYENKVTETILGQAFKLGIAYMPFDGLTLAMDVGDRYHAGMEYVLKNRIKFRAGVQKNRIEPEEILVPQPACRLNSKVLSLITVTKTTLTWNPPTAFPWCCS